MKLWSNNSVPKSHGSFNPERRLLAAVLQRAITDFLTTDGELFESARDWLFTADDNHESFGFSFVCEALDFHKEELRKAIEKQHARQKSSPAISLSDIDDAPDYSAAYAVAAGA